MKLLQFIPQIILLSTLLSGPAYGATCLAPQRPFVPIDPVAAAEYADLIRAWISRIIFSIFSGIFSVWIKSGRGLLRKRGKLANNMGCS